jgi:hypothetical protein
MRGRYTAAGSDSLLSFRRARQKLRAPEHPPTAGARETDDGDVQEHCDCRLAPPALARDVMRVLRPRPPETEVVASLLRGELNSPR